MIYLTQTDTTVGFLSNSKEELASAKNRDLNQPFIQCTDSFEKLKKLTRVPKKHKKLVRRAKKTTFIYPNNLAIRVVKDHYHTDILKRYNFLYSTSANEHKKSFNLSYATKKADIIVTTNEGFHESKASSLVKLSKNSKKYLRKL